MNSLLLSFSFLFSVLEIENCFGFRTIRNHAFTGPISERVYDLDWLGCIEACSRSEKCVSYNYKWRVSGEDEGNVCELIDDSGAYDECDTNSLTYVPGFTFHIIKENIKVTSCKEPCYQNVTKKVFTDCYELLLAGKTQSGIYSINPDGKEEFDVFCDQSTQGGGWVVFQKRFNGMVDFFRNWTSYKNGFGNLSGEFWLGLDKIHRLSSLKWNTLRVDLCDFNNVSAYAEYDKFKVLNEQDFYALGIGKYTGTSGDSLTWHNGLPYSTEDRNSGDCSAGNCATIYHGAWWYGDSFQSNLNGKYYLTQSTPTFDGIIWAAWRGFQTSLKKTEMKIRPCQDCT
ncbi:microfibril-associated glycoprotein 4-like [Oculina patagonica]